MRHYTVTAVMSFETAAGRIMRDVPYFLVEAESAGHAQARAYETLEAMVPDPWTSGVHVEYVHVSQRA